MPYMPGCTQESPPPLVLTGSPPPGAIRPPSALTVVQDDEALSHSESTFSADELSVSQPSAGARSHQTAKLAARPYIPYDANGKQALTAGA